MSLLRRSTSVVTLEEKKRIILKVRWATTGEYHSYRPGPIARLLRRVYITIAPSSLHRRLAFRLQAGMEKVHAMEREQLWLQRHGSPLRVLGLPEHAGLPELRTRYRELIIATHPDTASGDVKSKYDTIQTAYKMATSPTSLWHQNGSAPALYHHLLGRTRRVNRVSLFAFFSYCVMGIIGILFSVVVVKQTLEIALRFFDPDFYAFMLTQEKKEEEQRLAGLPVDNDPKRLAPTIVKRLLFPGRFIHNNDNNSENEK